MEDITSILDLWGLDPNARVSLINVSENLTYRIDRSSEPPLILRAHRIGYHSAKAIKSELAWAAALQEDGVIETPSAIPGLNGDILQEQNRQHFVLFEFIQGAMPNETDDLVGKFQSLGKIAAATHVHSLGWTRPQGFTRLTWDLDAILGPKPIWGRWQDAPNVTDDLAALIGKTADRITSQLLDYGMERSRFGLIHADMRLANLLVDGEDIRLIDFDDCGFGWYMYDFAAAVSFVETDPALSDWKAAWFKGYETIRSLTKADHAIMDSLIMLRRLNLLGWIGSHMEATEPQELAPYFAQDTADLAEKYLSNTLTR